MYLELCKGTNSGEAVYETDDEGDSGTRVFGGKCWGFIKTIKKVKISRLPKDEFIEDLAERFYSGEFEELIE